MPKSDPGAAPPPQGELAAAVLGVNGTVLGVNEMIWGVNGTVLGVNGTVLGALSLAGAAVPGKAACRSPLLEEQKKRAALVQKEVV